MEIICELFKALFNLNIDADDSTEDQKKTNQELVSTLYKFLTADHVRALDSEELKSHIVNLLTVVPISCYVSLVPEVSSDEQKKSKEIYQDLDMSAVWELLKFLDKRLDTPKNLVENTSPAVTTLLKLASSNSSIRKYTRQKVLPPLEDVMTRPEEGTTLKAKLCKLLTFPIVELRDIVAEFLFVLCKQNGIDD